MTAAKVFFQGLDYHWLTAAELAAGVKPCRFGFKCPRQPGNKCDGLLIVGADLGNGAVARRVPGQSKPAMWDWDGNVTEPTFSPSINCKTHTDDGKPAAGCGWHGYIQKGEIK
jgi:hypothetical protein